MFDGFDLNLRHIPFIDFYQKNSKFSNFSVIYFIQLLQFKVADLVNANRRLQQRLNKATTTQSDDTSHQKEVSFRLNSMPPISYLYIYNYINVQFRIRDERLFTDDDDPVPDFGEKVISFMIDDNNSFECPDKQNEGIRYRRDRTEVLHKKFVCETVI